MLTAIQICCLTGSVGRMAFVPPFSSFGINPYISIFLGPLILEGELSELNYGVHQYLLFVWVGGTVGSKLGDTGTV
jgi:hypothetical protein